MCVFGALLRVHLESKIMIDATWIDTFSSHIRVLHKLNMSISVYYACSSRSQITIIAICGTKDNKLLWYSMCVSTK